MPTTPSTPTSVMTSASVVLAVEPLGQPPWYTEDPFLFCVHHDDRYPAGNERLGPDASLAGRHLGNDFEGKDGWRMYHGEVVPGFPRHPHRGFETVTVVRRGLIDHSDSLGAGARYGDGDVQWLTAGDGIMHAEMFPLLRRDRPNPIDFFQIWLNLPAKNKRVAPHFSMLWAPTIPVHRLTDEAGRSLRVTTHAGALGSHPAPPPPPQSSWASQPESDVAIWTLELEPGARWTLPPAARGTRRNLYFVEGSRVDIGGVRVPARHRVQVVGDTPVSVEAGPDPTHLLLLQGRPIGEPVVKHGPFVMNTLEEIQQAYDDYRRTHFGSWPWPGDDPVHGREGARFARHADGRVERPV